MLLGTFQTRHMTNCSNSFWQVIQTIRSAEAEDFFCELKARPYDLKFVRDFALCVNLHLHFLFNSVILKA